MPGNPGDIAETVGSPSGGSGGASIPNQAGTVGHGGGPIDEANTVRGGTRSGAGGTAEAARDAEFDIPDAPTVTLQERQDREASAAQVNREEAAEREAERQAEEDAEAAAEQAEQDMAEAHANGEAYYAGEVEHQTYVQEMQYDPWGNPMGSISVPGPVEMVEQWILPGGTEVLRDGDGDIVSVSYPPGEEPEYQGDMVFDGQVCSIYELNNGATVAVTSEGDLMGFVDDLNPETVDLEPQTMVVDAFIITDDHDDIGDLVEVYVRPMGPTSYDTEIIDVNTGEVLSVEQTGKVFETGYSTYVPYGSDEGYLFDPYGNIVDVYEPPAEQEWSILGIVSYYDDGTVSVDVGVAQVNVDLSGSEMGIDVTLDILVASVGAGMEWDEDGSWAFTGEFDADVEGIAFGGDMTFGRDSDGHAFFDAETYVEMTLWGVAKLEGGQYLHFQQTDEGFEGGAGIEGRLSAGGLYIDHNQDFTLVLDKTGLTGTYTDVIGAGILGLGGFEVAHQVQGHTDGTLHGSGATMGQHFSLVDEGGDQIFGGGWALGTDDGFSTSEDRLDDRTRWEEPEDELPTGPDGGAADAFDFDDGRGGQRMPGGPRASGPLDERDRLDDIAAMGDTSSPRATDPMGGRSDRRPGLDLDDDMTKLPDAGPRGEMDSPRVGDVLDKSSPKFGDPDDTAYEKATPKFDGLSLDDDVTMPARATRAPMEASPPHVGSRGEDRIDQTTPLLEHADDAGRGDGRMDASSPSVVGEDAGDRPIVGRDSGPRADRSLDESAPDGVPSQTAERHLDLDDELTAVPARQPADVGLGAIDADPLLDDNHESIGRPVGFDGAPAQPMVVETVEVVEVVEVAEVAEVAEAVIVLPEPEVVVAPVDAEVVAHIDTIDDGPRNFDRGFDAGPADSLDQGFDDGFDDGLDDGLSP